MSEEAKSPRNESAEQRGGALVLALLIMVALTLLGTAFLSSSLNSHRITSNEVASTRAFGIAEAGIERARVALGTASVNTILAGGGNLLTNQSLDSGTYSVLITNNTSPRFPLGSIPADAGGASSDTDGYLVLTSTGALGSAQRRIEVIAKQNLISFGTQVVFGDLFITTTGSGDYMAPVGSNGNITPASQQIWGNATAHGAVVPSPNANVHGTITNAAPIVALPTQSCPGGAFGGPALTGHAGTYNAVTGDINFGTAAATGFPAGTYYYHNFTHTGTSALQVAAGATVTIYISGLATLSGFANANANAANLKIIGCGSDVTAWTIDNTLGTQYLSVYAPTHAITFSGAGGSDFYGGFVGKSITHASGGNIIFNAGVTIGSPNFATIQNSFTEKWL